MTGTRFVQVRMSLNGTFHSFQTKRSEPLGRNTLKLSEKASTKSFCQVLACHAESVNGGGLRITVEKRPVHSSGIFQKTCPRFFKKSGRWELS